MKYFMRYEANFTRYFLENFWKRIYAVFAIFVNWLNSVLRVRQHVHSAENFYRLKSQLLNLARSGGTCLEARLDFASSLSFETE